MRQNHLELIWREVLASALAQRLIPLGGVRLAPPTEGHRAPRIGLTAAGRYLVAATDEFDTTDAEAPDARIVVQPNFEVVFLAPAPHHDAQLAPLADRVGEHVGTLYRVTRDSIQRAAAAGIPEADTLERLTQANGGPLPPNVERSIQGWYARTRHVEGRRLWVIRCPDEETADRVESAAGKTAERLGPTAIAVSSRAKLGPLRKRLAKDGVHLELEDAGREGAPRRRP